MNIFGAYPWIVVNGGIVMSSHATLESAKREAARWKGARAVRRDALKKNPSRRSRTMKKVRRKLDQFQKALRSQRIPELSRREQAAFYGNAQRDLRVNPKRRTTASKRVIAALGRRKGPKLSRASGPKRRTATRASFRERNIYGRPPRIRPTPKFAGRFAKARRTGEQLQMARREVVRLLRRNPKPRKAARNSAFLLRLDRRGVAADKRAWYLHNTLSCATDIRHVAARFPSESAAIAKAKQLHAALFRAGFARASTERA